MTSILEALRELEEERRRTRTSRTVSVADAPADEPTSTSLLYPLVAGLAVGVIVVGLVAWWMGVGGPRPATMPDRSDAAGPTIAADGGSRNDGLAWLERADAPKARVERDGPARRPPAADTPARTSTAPAAGASAAPSRPVKAMVVESIRFATAPERRTVTLRLDGQRVTLRQGERAGGIEVQLILQDGAYLNRGADVVFAVPEG